MGEHDAVSDLRLVSDADDFIYEIRRDRFGETMKVWLCDAYLFADTDFYNRPAILNAGDYIIVAKPEAGFTIDYDLIRREKIGVGKIGKFMGAINLPEPWRFLDAVEREELKMRWL